MTVLVFWLAVGLANYARFALQGKSLLFRRRPPHMRDKRYYQPVRRFLSDSAEGLFEAAFFVILWPAQLGFWVVHALDERVFEPLRSRFWGAD